MIQTPTVFILGAGASKPYGYPTAAEMRTWICDNFPDAYRKRLATDPKLASAPAHREPLVREAKEFADAFNRSSNKSIDLFLARNREKYGEIGRQAIALCLNHAEKYSRFNEYTDDTEDRRKHFRSQDWYSWIFDRMTAGLTEPNDCYRITKENKVAFITFNYDVSLEFFLVQAFTYSFPELDPDIAAELLKGIPIVHTYGACRALETNGWDLTKRYGTEVSYDELLQQALRLEIMHHNGERQIDNATARLIRDAERVYFLGFSYAPENLETLRIPDILCEGAGPKRIYGTAKDATENEMSAIRKAVLHPSAPPRDRPTLPREGLRSCDCVELLRTTPPI